MFLRTERLFLRPAWLEDAPELTRAIGQEPVVRMLARAPWPYTEAHARAWIEGSNDPRSPTLLVTLPDEGGRIVGGCGINARDGRAEVGYWIEPGFWGRGFASEALAGMLLLARVIGHKRLIGRHAVDNPASGRVLRKAGFRPTGRVAPIHSLGRKADVDAPEYALELSDIDVPQDAPMPKAA